jgi:hypothetical protein
VTFKPSALGPRTGTITIVDTAAGSPHTISLSGTGTGPVVTLSPTSLSFQHAVNFECPPKAVTLTNSGTGPLTTSSIVPSGPFLESDTCLAASPLAAGASCTISVTFKPVAAGDVTGAVTITDNATGSPQAIALTGTGLPPCALQSTEHSMTVVRGTASTTFSIYDQKPSCHTTPLTLACQGAGKVSCQFSPAVIEPSGSSQLTVGNLAALAADTLDFTVTGTGTGRDTTAVDLQLRLADFSFVTYPPNATISAGQSANYSLTLAPANGLAGQIALKCSGAPAGATCGVSPSTVAMDGFTPVQAQVTVTTAARSTGAPGGSQGRRNTPAPLWLLALLTMGAAMVWAMSRRRRLTGLVLAGTLLLVLVWAACGGGGTWNSLGSSGTPAGTYTLTITGDYTTASGQTTNLSNNTNLSLTVN